MAICTHQPTDHGVGHVEPPRDLLACHTLLGPPAGPRQLRRAQLHRAAHRLDQPTRALLAGGLAQRRQIVRVYPEHCGHCARPRSAQSSPTCASRYRPPGSGTTPTAPTAPPSRPHGPAAAATRARACPPASARATSDSPTEPTADRGPISQLLSGTVRSRKANVNGPLRCRFRRSEAKAIRLSSRACCPRTSSCVGPCTR